MKKILERIQQYDKLSEDEAYNIIHRMSREEYNPAQLAAFIFAFNLRDAHLEEIMGFRAAMKSLSLPFHTDFETTDLCGTGGDGKDTFNISTLSSFITAGADVKVTKHGNYGVSSFCGSSNILESFGIKFSIDESILNAQLEKAGICFLHAPLFHPAMKAIAPIRRQLQVKTFFNMLGPLVNPSNPMNQLIGVFNLKVLKIYQFLHQQENRKVTLVHALDGYDEISLTGPFKFITPESEDLLSPENIGFKTVTQESLSGGKDIDDARSIFLNILEGKGTESQNSAVLANSGAAISNYKGVSLSEGILQAKESLDSGKALKSLKTLIELSN